MKKVMCIEDLFIEMMSMELPVTHPKLYGIYHVQSEYHLKGFTFYILSEIDGFSWEKSAFVDISDMDETEIAKQRIQETVPA